MKKIKSASWNDCLYSNSSVKITPDREKAKSLIEIAKERVDVLRKELNEKTANYIFEGYYSSIVEILHAIVLLEGYRVDNHVCLGYYLKDIIRDEGLFRLFDDCRFKRNSLVYYGKKMDFGVAKESIANAQKLFGELLKLFDLGGKK